MKLHHIGIATKSIPKTLEYLKKKFDVVEESDTVYDPNQDAELLMLTMSDGHMIELISGAVVETFVKKRQYLYHLCYSVDSIDSAIENHFSGDVVLSEPKPAVLFGGKRVVFIMTKIGLVELLESPQNN